MIIELILKTDEKHLLARLIDDKVVIPRRHRRRGRWRRPLTLRKWKKSAKTNLQSLMMCSTWTSLSYYLRKVRRNVSRILQFQEWQ